MYTKKLIGCLLLLILMFALINILTITKSSSDVNESLYGVELLKELNKTDLLYYIKYISQFDSRMTGYPGYYKVTQFIYNEFKKFGLEVYLQNYTITIPYAEYVNITYVTLNGERGALKAYALWPNLIETCSVPNGTLTARIVYVGSGTFEEIRKVNITDAIVLMDWNSKDNWLLAAKMGAKAVIFMLPHITSRFESMNKFVYANLYFPRFAIPRNEGITLLKLLSKGPVYVSISSKIIWKQMKVYNVIGFLEGTDPDLKKQAIIYAAYYDTWSPVLGLANDEDSACGIAALLEIAKLFSLHPPKRSVIFVALSGHWEALAGARYFVENYFEYTVDHSLKSHPIWSRVKPVWLMSLDLSSHSDSIALLYTGGFYHEKNYEIQRAYADIYEGFMVYFTGTWNSFIINLLRNTIGRVPTNVYLQPAIQSGGAYTYPQCPEYLTLILDKYILDVEPWIRAGLPGFTIYTLGDRRTFWFTPIKGINPVDLDNLYVQTAYALSLFYVLANVKISQPPYFPPVLPRGVPSRLISLGPYIGYEPGFAIARGIIMVYNVTSIYQYVPLKRRALVYIVNPQDEYSIFNYIFTFTNPNGTFIVYGLRPTTALVYYPYICRAFVINFTDGSILYAPDFGRFGAERIKTTQILTVEGGRYGWPQPFRIIVFRCGKFTLFDVLHPEGMRGPINNIDYYESLSLATQFTVRVLDHTSKSDIQHYYYHQDILNDILEIYAPVGRRFDIQIKAPSYSEVPETVILLLNASKENPDGHGYLIDKPGKIVKFTMVPLKYTLNLYYLSNKRYRTALKYHVIDFESQRCYNETTLAIRNVTEELNLGHTYYAYALAYNAWVWALKFYRATKSLIYGSITTVIIVLILLIPFAVMVERLLFEFREGKKRLLAILIVYGTVLGILWFTHPGFHLVSSIFVLILGFIILSITALIIFFVYNEFRSVMLKIRRVMLGSHFEEISRAELAISALSIGLMNMKRRKSSTILTMVTLILIISSLTSLTSMVPVIVYTSKTKPWKATYNGVLFRYTDYGPIPKSIVVALKGLVGDQGIVAPRAWYYPLPLGFSPGFVIYYNNRTAIGQAIVGITADEAKITKINRAIISGGNMWVRFWKMASQGEYIVPVLISNTLANDLGIKSIGVKIKALGMNMIVVGIFDAKAMLQIKDLDDQTLSPLELPEEGQQQVLFIHMPWDYVLIMPFSIVETLPGAKIVSIAIHSDNLNVLNRVTKYLAETTFNAFVLKGWKGKVSSYLTIAGTMLKGWSLLIAPLIIAALIILNTTLSLVQSRITDSKIFSAVGLSPLHVSLLFIAEIIAYAIISCVVGYLVGVGILDLLIITGNMPKGLYPNFASSFVALALGLSFLMVIIPSIYPAIKAGKYVTPSLERKWKIKTKPLGNLWTIPLPFRATTVHEALGVLYYIKEFLDAHRVERAHRWFASLRVANIEEIRVEGAIAYRLVTEVQLAPWEAGVRQRVEILTVPARGIYTYELRLTLLSGVRDQWIRSNPAFIDALRKQLLLWRALRPEEKNKYIQIAKSQIRVG